MMMGLEHPLDRHTLMMIIWTLGLIMMTVLVTTTLTQTFVLLPECCVSFTA